jgi:hypothetical protein
LSTPNQKPSQGATSCEATQKPWTPFLPCEPDPRDPAIQIYRNSRYQVHLRRYAARDGGTGLIHLSIKRLDGQPHIPYRERMRIKDELCGPEYEGVELLPARSREVDLANQTHLWIIDEPISLPFGFFDGRLVSEAAIPGATQDPWPPGERPAHCLSTEALRMLLRRQWSNRTGHSRDTEPSADASANGS